MLGGIEYNIGNYPEVLRVSEMLKANQDGLLMAKYFKAKALTHLDKNQAIELLLTIEPLFKKIYINDYYNTQRYISVLGSIIDYYYSKKNKQKTVEYIDKILKINSLNGINRYIYSGVKCQMLGYYKDAIKYYKKALLIQPENENIKKMIDVCQKL